MSVVTFEQLTGGYWLLGGGLVWLVAFLTRGWPNRRLRWLMLSALVAIIYAPSIITFAGNATIGPAWLTAIQQSKLSVGRPFWGVFPILAVWGVVYRVGRKSQPRISKE